jgi:hypothetical protein
LEKSLDILDGFEDLKHESKEGEGGKGKGGPEDGTNGKRGFSAGWSGTSYNAGNLECSALRILGCLLTAQGICAFILAGLT